MCVCVYYRTNVQENIDMIKLQREVKEKSTKFLMLQEKYSMLEEVRIWTCQTMEIFVVSMISDWKQYCQYSNTFRFLTNKNHL